MKKILLLATGGTIASRPTAAGGLAPAITSEELLACVPELADLCAVDAVQVFNLDSTNVGPAQWQSIVHCIKENYDAYDGFVIAHGTDTMAYTAAALSYMVQNSAKPVVLTGSQKSIYNRDTDARNNLYRAFVYACLKCFITGCGQLLFGSLIALYTLTYAQNAVRCVCRKSCKHRSTIFPPFVSAVTAKLAETHTGTLAQACQCTVKEFERQLLIVRMNHPVHLIP